MGLDFLLCGKGKRQGVLFPIIRQLVSHLTVLCEDVKPSFEYSLSLLAADLMKDTGEYFR